MILRTPQARLSWYRALPARTKKARCALGLLNTGGLPGGFTGYPVRDDYSAWHQFDGTLAGVQQCGAHLFRHLQGVVDLDPVIQAWAGETREVLREAHTAVEAAIAAGKDQLDPAVLAGFRARYDKHVTQARHPRPANHSAPGLGHRKSPRLHTRHPPPGQSRSGVAVHHRVFPALDQQSSRASPEKPHIAPESLRVPAHPHHPHQILHGPVLPHQRRQPRTPRHRRHRTCPHRQPLDATPRHSNMIN